MNDYVEKRPELVGISDYTRAWQNEPPFASEANNGAQMNPLDVIDTSAPQLSDAEVALLVKTEYGLDGQLRSLLSERDQNFRLTANDGQRYVVKIAGAAEDQKTADFQIQGLLHLEARGCKGYAARFRPDSPDDAHSGWGAAPDSPGLFRRLPANR